jgi:hypothetical protein
MEHRSADNGAHTMSNDRKGTAPLVDRATPASNKWHPNGTSGSSSGVLVFAREIQSSCEEKRREIKLLQREIINGSAS